MRVLISTAVIVAFVGFAPWSAGHSETTLRVVPHSDLKILAPIWTPS
jgi:hypothetical protein